MLQMKRQARWWHSNWRDRDKETPKREITIEAMQKATQKPKKYSTVTKVAAVVAAVALAILVFSVVREQIRRHKRINEIRESLGEPGPFVPDNPRAK
jgi:hypothetical protein